MGRILLIGQAPGPNTDPGEPLHPESTPTGQRLCALVGCSPSEFLRRFERINLLNEFPGRWKRDDVWPARDARIAASAIRPLLRGRRVIMIGRNVATAFGAFDDWPFHDWATFSVNEFAFAIVPHPSGRNHWYRKPGREAEARAFWSTFG